jgi:SAM-dependent methyltransferase
VNDPVYGNVPLSRLPAEAKARRAGSFGGAASDYERYRPGPPRAAVDWVVPRHVGRIVDLGAGTGALTRLLIDRADEVVAVEPDDRMRAVLATEVPAARAIDGRGESMPLADGFADAVIASSSWHWMDPLPTLHEVGRVLVPGGALAALWSGPDPDGAFMNQARAMLAQRSGDDAEVGDLMMADAGRPLPTLEILPGVPFDPPEHEVFTWDVALTADDLIGLLGTLSWIITMEPATRERVLTGARRMLAELLGVEGDVTVDVDFRCDVWRSVRQV